MGKRLLTTVIVIIVLLVPLCGYAQQPPTVVVEQNAGLAAGIKYQKWNVREITEVFSEKSFNSPIVAILNPGELVWGVTGDVHSSPVGKILITRDYQARGGKWLLEGDVIYPLYSLGNGVYRFWHQGDVLADSLLDIKGLFSTGEARMPTEHKVWGVSLEDLRRPGGEEWWVKVRLPDDRTGWTNRPYHFGNNGLFAYAGVTVVIDKRLVVFDASPLLENGIVWTSAEKLAEHFNALTRWDEQRGMLTISAEGKTVKLVKGSRAVIINDSVTTMDAPARTINGRFFVPVRALAEAFGRIVAWDGETRQVLITSY